MKRLLNSLMIIILLSGFLITRSTTEARAQEVVVSFQTFYDELSPYGQWVYDPQYGNVWVPNESGDFRPYGSRGHWVMTDYGNTWVSEDPWGWAVYHYGRWTYDPYYGWIWIPGYEWAPAWVSWRYGGGYCGWAPLGPRMSVGVSYGIPTSWWVFVGPQYIYEPNCIHYWRGPSYNTNYIHQTTIINNYYVDNSTHVRYNYGPRPEAIQQVTHQPVQVYRMQQMNRPGAPSIARNTVSLYRPMVNRASAANARPTNVIQAPRQIGRPAAATTISPSHQPAFRQEVMRHNPEMRGGAPFNARGNQPQPGTQQGNRPQPAMRNEPAGRTQPGNQPMNRPQPTMRNEPAGRPQPGTQPMNRPQPTMRNEPMGRPQPPVQQPMNRPQPPTRNEPMNRPQPPMRNEPMNRPQPPMHNEPMNRPQPPMRNEPMNRPEPPMRNEPMNRPQPPMHNEPMNRPQPPMHNEPMNRPQPPMQQPMNRPQPPMQQPMNRPQPPMQQPMNRPQPPMQQPMNRPQPPMQQPMNRPQPPMQQPMNRPQPPMQQPRMEPPHGAPQGQPQGQPHQEHPGGRR